MKIFVKRRWEKKAKGEKFNKPSKNIASRYRNDITLALIVKARIYIEVGIDDPDDDITKAENEYLFHRMKGDNVVLLNRKCNYKKVYFDGEERTSSISLPDIECDLQKAISHLQSEEAIKNGILFNGGQDFALIKLVIEEGLINGHDKLKYNSYQSFVDSMIGMGFGQVASRSTIYKFCKGANTKVWPWRYAESYANPKIDCDIYERNRRNLIVHEFIDYMSQLRGLNDAVNKFMNNSL